MKKWKYSRLLLWVLTVVASGPMRLHGAGVVRAGLPQEVAMSSEQLDEAWQLFEEAVQRDELRGAVVLVARRGTIVLHRAVGWRNREESLPMERETLFKMASNTKPVVATAIMQLAEQGKLALDDEVRKYVPAWDNQRSRHIKIRHLLNHTSGLRIPGIFLKPLIPRSDDNPAGPSLRAEVERFGQIGAEEEPGTTYSYNNPGFNTLGHLVEVTSKMPLAEYLRKQIYVPLGMSDSWNYEAHAPQQRMARVYRRREDAWEIAWSPGDGPDWPFVRASGGMISSAKDYAIFCQMYLNGGTYAGRRILSRASVADATANHTRSIQSQQQDRFYGLGWSVDADGAFGHGGSDGTHAWVDPHRQLIVLTFTQSPGGEIPREAFRQKVVAACDPKDFTKKESCIE